jgi:hypothetical protein
LLIQKQNQTELDEETTTNNTRATLEKEMNYF